jgi:hypothetical protein
LASLKKTYHSIGEQIQNCREFGDNIRAYWLLHKLLDSDQKRENLTYKSNKDTDKSSKTEKDRVKTRGNMRAGNKPTNKNSSKYCTFHLLPHMIPMNVRPRRIMTSSQIIK